MTSVYYSFYYKGDVNRVQLVRNMGVIEKQPLLTPQKWEEVEKAGRTAIEKWIAENMNYKSAVVVLIGENTASRPWVIYEIQKAWADKRPLVGIRIHGLSSFGSTSKSGADPFAKAGLTTSIPIFDPTTRDARGAIDTQATYNKLASNIESWVTRGVKAS